MKKTEFGLEYLIQNQHTIEASQRRHLWRTISTKNPEVTVVEYDSKVLQDNVDTSSISLSASLAAGWVLFPEAASGEGTVDTGGISIEAKSKTLITEYSLQEKFIGLTADSIETSIVIHASAKSTVVKTGVQDTNTAVTSSSVTTNIVLAGFSKNVVVRGVARETQNTGVTASSVNTDLLSIQANIT